jgi:GT2 family glycosyltransferase
MGLRQGIAPSSHAVAKRILIGTQLNDGYGSCPTCSQMARLSTYRFLGGFDPLFRRSEDTDFNVRLALAGGHFVGISTPLVIQTMTKTAEKNIKDEFHYARLLLEKHKAVIGSEKLYDFSCEWLRLKEAYLQTNYLDFVVKLLKLLISNPFLVLKRLYLALPNMRINQSFKRFHDAGDSLKKP